MCRSLDRLGRARGGRRPRRSVPKGAKNRHPAEWRRDDAIEGRTAGSPVVAWIGCHDAWRQRDHPEVRPADYAARACVRPFDRLPIPAQPSGVHPDRCGARAKRRAHRVDPGMRPTHGRTDNGSKICDRFRRGRSRRGPPIEACRVRRPSRPVGYHAHRDQPRQSRWQGPPGGRSDRHARTRLSPASSSTVFNIIQIIRSCGVGRRMGKPGHGSHTLGR